MSLVPFPSRTASVSGAVLSTVFSGQGVLTGIFVSPISGGQTTFSGSVITVQDATSGMAGVRSGNALFFNLDFGTQSGLTNGVNSLISTLTPSLPYMEGVCNSGLVVQGAVGWTTTVAYSK